MADYLLRRSTYFKNYEPIMVVDSWADDCEDS